METLDSLVKQRLTKLETVRKEGNPYQTVFKRDGCVQEILERFQESGQAKAAGRLTAIRSHGKTTFGDLRDQTGKVQLLFSEETLKERYAYLGTLDLGDIIGVEGGLFTTKTGEKTIRVSSWQLMAKALRPPP